MRKRLICPKCRNEEYAIRHTVSGDEYKCTICDFAYFKEIYNTMDYITQINLQEYYNKNKVKARGE